MKRKSIFRNFFSCLLILISIIFSFTIMEGKGKWIFPSPDNEAVAEVTNIKIPEWSFLNYPYKSGRQRFLDIDGNELYYSGITKNGNTGGDYYYKLGIAFHCTFLTKKRNEHSPIAIMEAGFFENNRYDLTIKENFLNNLEIPAFIEMGTSRYTNKNLSTEVHPVTCLGIPEGINKNDNDFIIGFNRFDHDEYYGTYVSNEFSHLNYGKAFDISVPPTVSTINEGFFTNLGFSSLSFSQDNNVSIIGPSAFASNRNSNSGSQWTSHTVKSKQFVNPLFPGKITSIGANAFCGCRLDGLLNVNLDSVLKDSFKGSTIGTLKLSSSKEPMIIPAEIFYESNIQNLSFENYRISKIEPKAFYGCKIDEIDLSGAEINTIGEEAFWSISSTKDNTPVSISFNGSKIDTIAKRAFSHAYLNTNLYFGKIRSIEEEAFAMGKYPYNIYLRKSGIRNLGANCFHGHEALKSKTTIDVYIEIPINTCPITNIGTDAFLNDRLYFAGYKYKFNFSIYGFSYQCSSREIEEKLIATGTDSQTTIRYNQYE